ncbi:MAG: glycosyltransferase, partial [Planctomycetota bacterium]
MKVLFVTAWYPSSVHSVAGIFVREHAKAISLYNEVTVLYPEIAPTKLSLSDRIEDGLRTIRVFYRVPTKYTTVISQLCAVYKAFRYLRKHGYTPDIIHSNTHEAGMAGLMLAKFYHRPMVITEHYTGFVNHPPLTLRQKLLAKCAMAQARVVMPVSNYLRDGMIKLGINNEFYVIPNVVNTDIFFSSNKGVINKAQKKILFVGLPRPQKGLNYLLEAISIVSMNREDFVLDIIGSSADDMGYEALTVKLGLKGKVRFHGIKLKNEVAELMRQSDFVVLPGLFETFGVAAIEALASGKPVITTSTGIAPEVISKETGLLVPPGNTGALKNAIEHMLDHFQDYDPQAIA